MNILERILINGLTISNSCCVGSTDKTKGCCRKVIKDMVEQRQNFEIFYFYNLFILTQNFNYANS